eukprot:1594822-Pyramimonas_sp.AAC.2
MEKQGCCGGSTTPSSQTPKTCCAAGDRCTCEEGKCTCKPGEPGCDSCGMWMKEQKQKAAAAAAASNPSA